jgi:hypothetical protein
MKKTHDFEPSSIPGQVMQDFGLVVNKVALDRVFSTFLTAFISPIAPHSLMILFATLFFFKLVI